MKNVRPAIGICTPLERVRFSVWDVDAFVLARSYVDAVHRAGAMALLLAPDPALVEDPDELLDRLDGLVLAGGADISPDRYGEGPHRQTGGIRPDRDAAELPLLEGALGRDLPVLGICRGLQLMVVAHGGRLLQHLPEVVGHDGHRPAPGRYGEHAVTTAEGSRLRAVLGECVDVPSYHHQGVGDVGAGLTATAWADDGTVEGVERSDRPFTLGVLWHPEAGDDLRLFRALVDTARSAAHSGVT